METNAWLAERVEALLAGCDATTATADLTATPADAVTVDALARMQLAARRCGSRLRLRDPPRALTQLIEFIGLADVLTE